MIELFYELILIGGGIVVGMFLSVIGREYRRTGAGRVPPQWLPTEVEAPPPQQPQFAEVTSPFAPKPFLQPQSRRMQKAAAPPSPVSRPPVPATTTAAARRIHWNEQ